MFLYGSSEPTKTTVGRSGSGAGGRSVNAERSLKAVKTALGATPRTSSISFEVYVETARVASACLTARAASTSTTGAITRREGEP